MAEVLVLVDHADGAVKKVTLELLTIAASLGEPAAVVLRLGHRHGAPSRVRRPEVYVAESADYTDYAIAPAAEVLAELVASKAPAAVLIASSAEGKEIAGVLAVTTDSGVITDAVAVSQDGQLHGRTSSAARSSCSPR